MLKKTIIYLLPVLICAIAFAETDPKWSVGISMTPASVSVGDTVRFTATLWVKQGPVDNLRIIGGVDGTHIFTRDYRHCDRQYLEELNFTWTAVAGNHRAWFQIDPDATTPDIDRSNNRTEISFLTNISPPARDGSSLTVTVHSSTGTGGGHGGNTLTLTGRTATLLRTIDPCEDSDAPADLSLDFLGFNRVSLSVDDPVQYNYTFRVKNLGSKCIKEFKWRIVNNVGVVITEGTKKTLKVHGYVIRPGHSIELTGVIDMASIGNYDICRGMSGEMLCVHVKGVVDPLNDIFETDETNNESPISTLYWRRIE
jgi:hypothetical protein